MNHRAQFHYCCHNKTLPKNASDSETSLTKELAVVLHGSSIQRVKHSMPGAVCCTGAAVGLTAASKVQRLASKRALVDLAILCAAEGQAVVLQLNDCLGRFPAGADKNASQFTQLLTTVVRCLQSTTASSQPAVGQLLL
jgi:hypothetical protein